MVILMSATRIILHAHNTGTRYLYRGPSTIDKDYNFSITADGGVCTTGSFQSPVVANKYPAAGQAMMAGTLYDENPLGGLGGMGIVQLMAPPGDNLDGTNTALDDNIVVVLPTNAPAGVTKQSVLGWRGHPNAAGTVFVGDDNVPFTAEEGDIRPAPILLPVPFNGQTRLRSKWLDTGASKRRDLVADDGQPRGLVASATSVLGPTFEFGSLDLSATIPGYVAYEPIGQTGTKILYPTPVAATAVTAVDANASYLGAPAYGVTLASAALGTEDDRYRQYEAELLNTNGDMIGSFRILSHTGSSMLLAPDSELLPEGVAQARVRAKFFKIVTKGSEGLGPVYLPSGSSTPIPNANVRIGFAFHTNPTPGGNGLRYPADPKVFVHSMNDAGLQTWIATNGAPRYVQWDVTFDATFRVNGSVPPSLSPDSPLPELHWLRIPFRF